jgi:hypothetical protein
MTPVRGKPTFSNLRSELRRSIAQRRRLRAQYDAARTELETSRKTLIGLLSRQDFVALLRTEGMHTMPAFLVPATRDEQ